VPKRRNRLEADRSPHRVERTDQPDSERERQAPRERRGGVARADQARQAATRDAIFILEHRPVLVGIEQGEVDQLRVSIGGTAAAIVAGEAGKASVTVRGTGSFDGARLASKDAAITADGPATIKADIANSATIEGYGPATITLTGGPACTVRLKGSASVSGCKASQ